VKPLDAVTFSVATAMLLAIAAFACVVPALRAILVDATAGLRHE
jgi:ABC-type lipoprotein release transport system permease subunit